MPDDIDIRITPSLHPSTNVEHLDGYDESLKHLLGPTETALSVAYQGIGQVHTARDAAKLNPTWNEASQIIQTQNLADKVERKIHHAFYSARATLEKGIEHLERELSAPVTAKAAHPVASEIRSHCKSLKTNERMAFVQRAISEKDEATATALLGAPAYLSGFTAEMQQLLTRQYHERFNPEAARRIKLMGAANDMLTTRHAMIEVELEKAVGAPPHKAKALRAAKTAAEKHFVMASA